MSSFPISITWQVAAPPVGGFTQMANAAKSLDSALLSSGQNMQQFGQSITQIESPLSGAATGMQNFASGVDQLANPLGASVDGMAELATSTEQLNGSIGDTASGIQEAAGGFGDLASGATDSGSAMGDLSGSIEDTNSGLSDMTSTLGDTNSGLTETNSALTETGTALTDTNTALTETNTALTDTNTAMMDTVTTTGDLNGGLIDVAATTKDTSTQTVGLNKSVGILGTGMVGLVGAGVQLFNAYDNLGDAEMRVEQANNRLERSQVMLESKMNALSKTTAKMSQDSSLMVNGLGAWTSAQDTLNQLIAEGTTSGAEWDAALQAAKVAQDGLSSSTTKGNALIRDAGIQLDQAAVAADRMSINAWQVTNAQEAQVQAWGDTVTALVTIAGVGGNVTLMLTGMKSAAGTASFMFKDLAAWIARGGLALGGIKGTLVAIGGAFAAVAVPVGIAIAALAAFVLAVTAIRVNIKVFDDMGKAIGSVFPQSVGFLNDLRQGFINLSDAVNSSISWILGGIDALSGGTTKAQEGWEKWTKTLPQGTGQISLAGEAAREAAIMMGYMGETAQIGAGKFKVVNDNLYVLKDAATGAVGEMKAVAGAFYIAGNGTAVYVKGATGAKQATEDLTGTTREYIPLSETLTSASTDQAAANADLAELTSMYGDILKGNIPAIIKTVQQQTEAAMTTGEMGDASATTGEQVNEMGGSLDIAAEGTANLGAGAEQTVDALTPLEQSLAEVVNKLNAEEEAAAKAHVQNVQMLALWKVDIPDALLGSREAIQALVNIYGEENAAVNENKVAAFTYIGTHGTMQDMVLALQGDVIKYAESMGFETEASKAAAEAHEKFSQKLEDGKKALDEAGKSTYELTKAVAEGGAEAVKETEARRQQAIALGVYDEMIQLAIEDQQPFLDGQEAEIKNLQALAKARGMDNAELENSKRALQDYITTHERLPPTQEEVLDKYTELITAKQDERYETELSRQALALYVETQYGVVDATNASVGELEAFITTMERITNATDTARAAIATWIGDLIAAKAEEAALKIELLAFADLLGIQVPDAANQTSESIKTLIEDATGLGEAFEREKEKIKTAIDEIAQKFEESTGMMESAFKRVGDAIGGDEWKEDLSEWEDDLDNTLAGMTIAVDDTFGAKIPDILATFNGDANAQFSAVKGYLSDLKGQIDMSPVAWESAFGEIEGILNNAQLTTAEKMALIEADIAGLWERAKPKLMAGAGIMTDAMEGFIKGNMLPAIESALASKDPTAKLLEYFNNLPQETKSQMSLFTGILKQAGGDVEKAITTIVGYLQSKDIAIPESTINAMANAFNVPAATIKQKIAEMSGNIKTLPTDTQTAAQQTEQALAGLGPAADQARVQWALQIGKMNEIMAAFTQKQMELILVQIDNWKFLAEQMLVHITTAGGYVLTFTEALNVFATEFMPKWIEDINNNALIPVVKYWETMILAVGEHILTLSEVLNTFAATFLPAWAEDINTHLTTAAEYFATFGQIAGENLLASAELLNQFAADFMSAFANDIQTHLETAADHFTTFAQDAGENVFKAAQELNKFASAFMSAFARDIGTHVTTAASHFTKLTTAAKTTSSQVQSAFQQMTSKASSFASSFGSSMSKVVSDANKAASAVKALKSAIDSLKSKSITITTTYVTRYRTVYVAKGGAFVTSTPTQIGPLKASEFSQRELVTVTPLESPGRRSLTGGVERKARRALDEERETKATEGRKKEMIMMRETPIVIQIDGREITRVVNRRLFEGSDSLT